MLAVPEDATFRVVPVMLQLVPLVGPVSPEVEMVRCCACKKPADNIRTQQEVARSKEANKIMN